jgi:hypothetical protein
MPPETKLELTTHGTVWSRIGDSDVAWMCMGGVAALAGYVWYTRNQVIATCHPITVQQPHAAPPHALFCFLPEHSSLRLLILGSSQPPCPPSLLAPNLSQIYADAVCALAFDVFCVSL